MAQTCLIGLFCVWREELAVFHKTGGGGGLAVGDMTARINFSSEKLNRCQISARPHARQPVNLWLKAQLSKMSDSPCCRARWRWFQRRESVRIAKEMRSEEGEEKNNKTLIMPSAQTSAKAVAYSKHRPQVGISKSKRYVGHVKTLWLRFGISWCGRWSRRAGGWNAARRRRWYYGGRVGCTGLYSRCGCRCCWYKWRFGFCVGTNIVSLWIEWEFLQCQRSRLVMSKQAIERLRFGRRHYFELIIAVVGCCGYWERYWCTNCCDWLGHYWAEFSRCGLLRENFGLDLDERPLNLLLTCVELMFGCCWVFESGLSDSRGSLIAFLTATATDMPSGPTCGAVGE